VATQIVEKLIDVVCRLIGQEAVLLLERQRQLVNGATGLQMIPEPRSGRVQDERFPSVSMVEDRTLSHARDVDSTIPEVCGWHVDCAARQSVASD
jgi:hypothetical protein